MKSQQLSDILLNYTEYSVWNLDITNLYITKSSV